MKHLVCSLEELERERKLAAVIDRKPIVIVRSDQGTVHALRDICPHKGPHLSDGMLDKNCQGATSGEYLFDRNTEVLRCPWRSWEFDIRTGKSLFDPEKVRVKTYPVAIAAPSGNRFPLLLDMALSNAALGKILHAKAQGVPIPEGWGADRSGGPTTDPAAVMDGGFLLPVGGPKGFGLAMMIELLTGVLGDSQFSKLIPSMYDLSRKQSIAHFMLVIDVNCFIDLDRFRELASQLSAYVKGAAKAVGVTELYLPGEIEFQAEQHRMASGIPIEPKVVGELNQLAESLGVAGLH